MRWGEVVIVGAPPRLWRIECCCQEIIYCEEYRGFVKYL